MEENGVASKPFCRTDNRAGTGGTAGAADLSRMGQNRQRPGDDPFFAAAAGSFIAEIGVVKFKMSQKNEDSISQDEAVSVAGACEDKRYHFRYAVERSAIPKRCPGALPIFQLAGR